MSESFLTHPWGAVSGLVLSYIVLYLAHKIADMEQWRKVKAFESMIENDSLWAFFVVLLSILVLLFLVWPKDAQAAVPSAAHYRGCYDGDTCYFDLAGFRANQSVRLLGVDTPEIKAQCPQEKLGALAAKNFSRSVLARARFIQVLPQGYDKYGRDLAQVLADGLDMRQRLIEQCVGHLY